MASFAVKYKTLRVLLFLMLMVQGYCFAQPMSTPSGDARPGGSIWIERPWSMRYFMYVESADGWDSTKKIATKFNARSSKKGAIRSHLGWEELFSPDHVIKLKVPDVQGKSNLAVVTMTFDQGGLVTSAHSHSKPLRGRINHLLELGLSEGDSPADRFYTLSYWFTGLGDISTHWAPAYCSIDQQPDPVAVRSDAYLYGKRFKPNDLAPLFGCREWAYQLYDNDRPYIDVTSYEPTVKGKPSKPYIREFIGWARFGDSKPVIGQHEGNWYCLHDCPDGDKPGLIPDIKSWAKRFDWFEPMPPTRVPTFPDPPVKSGTYPRGQKILTTPAGNLNKPAATSSRQDVGENDFPDAPADLGC